MNKNESLGQRSQRTILQALHESIPQLFLQIYMTKRLSQMNETLDANQKMNVLQIYISIGFGVVNLMFIYIEQLGLARALDLDTPTYLFMSLNG
jgi:hypothetical protein